MTVNQKHDGKTKNTNKYGGKNDKLNRSNESKKYNNKI